MALAGSSGQDATLIVCSHHAGLVATVDTLYATPPDTHSGGGFYHVVLDVRPLKARASDPCAF